MASQGGYCRRNFFFSITLHRYAIKIFFTAANGCKDRWLDAWYFVRCISFACLGVQNRSQQITKMVRYCIYSSFTSYRHIFL